MDEEEVSAFIKPAFEYVDYVTKLIDVYFDDQSANSTSEWHNWDAQRIIVGN